MVLQALIKQGDLRVFIIYPDIEGNLPQKDMLNANNW